MSHFIFAAVCLHLLAVYLHLVTICLHLVTFCLHFQLFVYILYWNEHSWGWFYSGQYFVLSKKGPLYWTFLQKKWDFFSDFQNTVVRVYCLCIIKRTQRRKVFAWKTLLHDESLFLSPFLPESKVNKMRHSVLSTEQWSMTHTLISAENVCKMKRWKMRHFAAWHVMHSLIVNDPSPNNLQLLK